MAGEVSYRPELVGGKTIVRTFADGRSNLSLVDKEYSPVTENVVGINKVYFYNNLVRADRWDDASVSSLMGKLCGSRYVSNGDNIFVAWPAETLNFTKMFPFMPDKSYVSNIARSRTLNNDTFSEETLDDICYAEIGILFWETKEAARLGGIEEWRLETQKSFCPYNFDYPSGGS